MRHRHTHSIWANEDEKVDAYQALEHWFQRRQVQRLNFQSRNQNRLTARILNKADKSVGLGRGPGDNNADACQILRHELCTPASISRAPLAISRWATALPSSWGARDIGQVNSS